MSARPPSTTGAGLRMRRKFTQNRFGQSALVAVQQGLREVALVRHGAKLSELRAAMSLAPASANQGRRSEVRDPLAPGYGWFTEGFDTQDLNDAGTLLEEVR
jgi:predicted ATPase